MKIMGNSENNKLKAIKLRLAFWNFVTMKPAIYLLNFSIVKVFIPSSLL